MVYLNTKHRAPDRARRLPAGALTQRVAVNSYQPNNNMGGLSSSAESSRANSFRQLRQGS